MRFRSTWILLAVAAAAFGYYFLVEQPRHHRERDRLENRTRLTSLAPDLVSQVVIRRHDDTLEFTREGAAWRMLRPVEDAADQGKVNVLVRTIIDARIDGRMNSVDSLSRYGLDPPAAVVFLSGEADETRLRVGVGRLNLTKDSCYGIRGDEPDVLLLPAGVRHAALRDVFDYRDKRVVSFAVESVHRMRITSTVGASDWRRRADGSWHTVQHGDTIRGDTTELENILRRIRGLRAKRILTENEAVARFEHPAGRLSVWTDGDSLPEVLVVSKETPTGCYLRRSKAARVDLVDRGVLSIFNKEIEDLRDRRAVHFDAAELARIAITADERSMSVVKAASEWQFPNPGMGPVDQAAVAAFLRTLGSLKFRHILHENLLDPSAYGLDRPGYHLTLFGPGGKVMDELRASALDEERRIRLATSRSSGHLATVDDEPLAELLRLFEAFKAP